jgi:hypothetical protein
MCHIFGVARMLATQQIILMFITLSTWALRLSHNEQDLASSTYPSEPTIYKCHVRFYLMLHSVTCRSG